MKVTDLHDHCESVCGALSDHQILCSQGRGKVEERPGLDLPIVHKRRQ